MSELKCPFCQQELKNESEIYVCRNPNCKHLLGFGTKELWQELIRTRKALEIAVDGIKYMRNNCLEYAADYMDKADEILEQITALEQKDKRCGGN